MIISLLYLTGIKSSTTLSKSGMVLKPFRTLDAKELLLMDWNWIGRCNDFRFKSKIHSHLTKTNYVFLWDLIQNIYSLEMFDRLLNVLSCIQKLNNDPHIKKWTVVIIWWKETYYKPCIYVDGYDVDIQFSDCNGVGLTFKCVEF